MAEVRWVACPTCYVGLLDPSLQCDRCRRQFCLQPGDMEARDEIRKNFRSKVGAARLVGPVRADCGRRYFGK